MSEVPPESPVAPEGARTGEHAVARADALDALAVLERDARDIRWTARLSAALAWVVVAVWGATAPGGFLGGVAILLTLIGIVVEVWAARRIRRSAEGRAALSLD